MLDRLGWTPDYLSFQNEPGYVSPNYTCVLRPTETAENAGYAESADAIWNAIKDRPDVPKMLGPEIENIKDGTIWPDWNGGAPVNSFEAATTPLKSRDYFDAYGYHIYNVINESRIDDPATIAQLNLIRDSFGDRPHWMAEFSKDVFDWHQTARIIHRVVTEANAAAYLHHKLMWAAPKADGIVRVDIDGSYSIGEHFYTMKHYAKHVDKGDTRFETLVDSERVQCSGYLSPDGSRATIVLINKSLSSENLEFVNDSLDITSVEGFQSTDGNFYQPMSLADGLDALTLPPVSLTTLVLTLDNSYSFADWIGEFDVGLSDAFDEDADGDGRANALEHFFGTRPDISDSAEIHVLDTLESGGDGFQFTHPQASRLAEDLSHRYQWSYDLVNFFEDGESDGNYSVTFTVEENTPSEGTTTIQAIVTGDPLERLFTRILLLQTP
jgi:hypothetical protein